MTATERGDAYTSASDGGAGRDEKRSPGYLPQGRRAPLAVLGLVIVALLGRVVVHSAGRTVVASFVILVGIGAFWVASRMNQRRLEDERYMRGPGWLIGLLISKTSVPVARAIYVLMGIGICALGVADLVR